MPLGIVHHPHYAAEMPRDHRFPMGKFRALADHLQGAGLLGPDGFIQPRPATRAQLLRAHDAAYVDAVLACDVAADVERRIGLPITAEVVRRARAATGGTIMTADLALQRGIACNTAGGSHHAMRAGGAGFCVFNDVAVAALEMLETGRARRVLVIDCDVHQGDGVAEIFAMDDRVVTLSIHCVQNFPARKQMSTIDVPLDRGSGDDDYLEALRQSLETAFSFARFDLIFYNAGVDVHVEDALGYLALSDAGIEARDRCVIRAARSRGIPLAGVIGGGYSKDIAALARRHAILFDVAAQCAA